MLKNSNISKKQIAETGVVFATLSILFFAFGHINFCLWISIGFLIVTLLFPVILKPFAILWFELAKVLSFTTSRIILCLLFFTLVTPVGMIRKLLGKDSLQLKAFKNNKASSFVNRNHEFNSSDLKYPF
jgi:hypothetical protein